MRQDSLLGISNHRYKVADLSRVTYEALGFPFVTHSSLWYRTILKSL